MAGIKQIHKKSRQIDLDSLFLGTQDEWLLKTLDTHLTSTQFSQRPEVFYPSTLGNPCDRYLWLHYNGLIPKKPISATLQRIFGVGNSAEDRYAKYFGDMMLYREQSCKIDSPILLSGRADFILHYDGRLFVLELKTINQRGWDIN